MFKNILVPLHIDYKENHEKLFAGALRILDKEKGTLSLLYVNENKTHGTIYPVLGEEVEKNYNNEALLELKKIAIKNKLPQNISLNIREGSSHREILEEAKRINADAIVMMASKPRLGSYFISSTAERVIRHAFCSVFVIRLTSYN